MLYMKFDWKWPSSFRRGSLKLLIHSILVTFGQDHWMTLLWYSHVAWCTILHITEYHFLEKYNVSHFLYSFKSPRYQIWPLWKRGQGLPRVTIWTNLVVLSHLMLHTMFQGNQPCSSGKEAFLRFLPYMGIVAILFMRPGAFEQIFNLPLPVCCIWNLILIGPVVSEKKSFEKGYDATDDGSLSKLYAPLDTWLWWAQLCWTSNLSC